MSHLQKQICCIYFTTKDNETNNKKNKYTQSKKKINLSQKRSDITISQIRFSTLYCAFENRRSNKDISFN